VKSVKHVVEEIVLAAIQNLNLARRPEDQLLVSPSALIFGEGSPLDSMGLVSLIIDIEELLLEKGYHVTLSDERAVSQVRSPFRNVPVMVEYIYALINEHESKNSDHRS
jgi:hypothetical protein